MSNFGDRAVDRYKLTSGDGRPERDKITKRKEFEMKETEPSSRRTSYCILIVPVRMVLGGILSYSHSGLL